MGDWLSFGEDVYDWLSNGKDDIGGLDKGNAVQRSRVINAWWLKQRSCIPRNMG